MGVKLRTPVRMVELKTSVVSSVRTMSHRAERHPERSEAESRDPAFSEEQRLNA